MNTKEYLLKIKDFLEKNDLEWLDNFFLDNTKNIPIDILENITEYITTKDNNYKNKSIELINNYKEKKSFFEKIFNL